MEAKRRLDDASPLVRGAAVWALSRLMPRDEFEILALHRSDDDALVMEEWRGALT
jgi:epoxyqueuosine reductase